MRAATNVKRTLTILLATNCLTPIAVLIVWGIERLLAALGDESGAIVFGRIGLAAAAFWLLTLVAMLLALTVAAIGSPRIFLTLNAKNSSRISSPAGHPAEPCRKRPLKRPTNFAGLPAF